MGTGDINLKAAAAIVGSLAKHGVKRLVASPGSRSTPLILAANAHPNIELSMLTDERSAAFFALGICKALGDPVGLIATSGSAPAHWHPAVLEAEAACLPLICLSADRPADLIGCGANQTIDQLRLFSNAVRGFYGFDVPSDQKLSRIPAVMARMMDQATWPLPGPIQINIAFDEPLLPTAYKPTFDDTGKAVRRSVGKTLPNEAELMRLAALLQRGNGIVVAGWDAPSFGFGTALTGLAKAIGAPIFADPLSGLRNGAHDRGNVLCRYDAFLRGTDQPKPDWVLRFGAMPVSKSLCRWLGTLSDIPQLAVSKYGRWIDPDGVVSTHIAADPADLCKALRTRVKSRINAPWLDIFKAKESRAALLAEEINPPEAEIVKALRQSLPSGAVLVVGNSMPVRELDNFLANDATALRVLCNRGVSGIDGTVSTAFGIKAALGPKRPVAALLGDLTFAHDLGGLQAVKLGLDVTFVVIDNGGGGIFEYLPQSGLDRELFDRCWLTPQAPDLKAAADLWGLSFLRAIPETLGDALSQAKGATLIAVTVDRNESVGKHRAYWDAF